MELFKHTGILHYSTSGPYRLVVDVNPELAAYYRALMPKYLRLISGRYPAHVTVVRVGRDEPKNLSVWGKYEGKHVEFCYEPGIHSGKDYYWLRVLSKQLEEIRAELGLELDVYATPPLPFIKYFHLTIGNTKL